MSEAQRIDEPAATAPVRGAVTVQDPTRAQQLVTRRVAESRATIPDVTVATAIDVTDLVGVVAGAAGGWGLDDALLAACAWALREHPAFNGAYRDGRVEAFSRVNIGITVEAQDSLIVPTLFDADALALHEIAARRGALSARALDATITAPEVGGQTFTVMSLVAAGPVVAIPTVTPGQAAAIAFGAPEPRVVAHGGDPAVRAVLDAVLACDQRVIQPPAAARFLSAVRERLEAPAAWAEG